MALSNHAVEKPPGPLRSARMRLRKYSYRLCFGNNVSGTQQFVTGTGPCLCYCHPIRYIGHPPVETCRNDMTSHLYNSANTTTCPFRGRIETFRRWWQQCRKLKSRGTVDGGRGCANILFFERAEKYLSVYSTADSDQGSRYARTEVTINYFAARCSVLIFFFCRCCCCCFVSVWSSAAASAAVTAVISI